MLSLVSISDTNKKENNMSKQVKVVFKMDDLPSYTEFHYVDEAQELAEKENLNELSHPDIYLEFYDADGEEIDVIYRTMYKALLDLEGHNLFPSIGESCELRTTALLQQHKVTFETEKLEALATIAASVTLSPQEKVDISNFLSQLRYSQRVAFNGQLWCTIEVSEDTDCIASFNPAEIAEKMIEITINMRDVK